MAETSDIKILVVDDTRTSRMMLSSMLQQQGYKVSEADSANQALTQMKQEIPDIILMDIVMPDMDGIECCRKIKSDPKLQRVKIVMVTSESEYTRITEAFKADCSDYVIKPVNPNELLYKIRDISKFVDAVRTLSSATPKMH